MADYIGSIEVLEVIASDTFPLAPRYPYAWMQPRPVVVHQFGSGNSKIEQRFYLGTGAKRWVVRLPSMSEAERKLLRNFWETNSGGYGAFTFNAPDDAGSGYTSPTCRFENAPLEWEYFHAAITSAGVTLVEIPDPAAAPQYTLNDTCARFPSSDLKTALLSQVQEIIPLVHIIPRESGYPEIFVSDRRCKVGTQWYLPRLLRLSGITQEMGNAADDAAFVFGNADRVMRDLVNDTNLKLSTISLSLFHVGSGIKLELWLGTITDWSFNAGEEFTITASDGLYELGLMYPTRKISRMCWKKFADPNTCPYSGGHASCDKGFATPNGCHYHGMDPYFGGIIANPQSVYTKDNSSGTWGFGRSPLTSTSIVSNTIYDQILQEIYTDSDFPIPCKIVAGRDEVDFYTALGIVGAGPLGAFALQSFSSSPQITPHLLDGQPPHGASSNPPRDNYGWRASLGPTPNAEPFCLGQGGAGIQTYTGDRAAGVVFFEIRRTDAKGLQLSKLEDHSMQVAVNQGLAGWYWTAPTTRAPAVLTNPVWIAVNMLLRARGLGFAIESVQRGYFDVDSAIAAAVVCDTLVDSIVGGEGTCSVADSDVTWATGDKFYKAMIGKYLVLDASDYQVISYTDDTHVGISGAPGDDTYNFTTKEKQFKFRGIIQEEKPLRDWIQEMLMNCLGYFTMANGKLKIGVRVNSSTVEAFTVGNILFNSLSLTPVPASFNHLTANFADEEYNYAGNSIALYDEPHAELIGGATSPVYLKSSMNLSGTPSKSQAARIVTTRLREEIGGIDASDWKAARKVAFKTTILALKTEPGMVCSMTHPDISGLHGKVNTSGTAVSWVSGDKFTAQVVGKTVLIAGVEYLVDTFTDDQHIVLHTSAGTQTGVLYAVITGEFRVAGWRLNEDYSIDIAGQTTVDSMYDLAVGPKPADVQASPVPEEVQYEPADWNFQVETHGDGNLRLLDFVCATNPATVIRGIFDIHHVKETDSTLTWMLNNLDADDTSLQLRGDVVAVDDYLQIQQEIVRVTAITTGPPNQVVVIVRAQLGTTAASHIATSATVSAVSAVSNAEFTINTGLSCLPGEGAQLITGHFTQQTLASYVAATGLACTALPYVAISPGDTMDIARRVYRLAVQREIVNFQPRFFKTAARASFVHEISLPSARVAAVVGTLENTRNLYSADVVWRAGSEWPYGLRTLGETAYVFRHPSLPTGTTSNAFEALYVVRAQSVASVVADQTGTDASGQPIPRPRAVTVIQPSGITGSGPITIAGTINTAGRIYIQIGAGTGERQAMDIPVFSITSETTATQVAASLRDWCNGTEQFTAFFDASASGAVVTIRDLTGRGGTITVYVSGGVTATPAGLTSHLGITTGRRYAVSFLTAEGESSLSPISKSTGPTGDAAQIDILDVPIPSDSRVTVVKTYAAPNGKTSPWYLVATNTSPFSATATDTITEATLASQTAYPGASGPTVAGTVKVTINQNGNPWCEVRIAADASRSNVVDGLALEPLAEGAVLTADVVNGWADQDLMVTVG